MSIEALDLPPCEWICGDPHRATDGDPHGCCNSCGYCMAMLNLHHVQVMLALAEQGLLLPTSKQVAKGSQWPGPKNVPVKVRRYVTLGLPCNSSKGRRTPDEWKAKAA